MTTLYEYCKQNNKEYLLDEWDYDKNGDLTPENVTHGSNKRVWWVCSYCGNIWKTSVYHRAVNGTGCTKCYHSKRKNSVIQNNLIVTHPDLVKDWNYEKNGKFTPDMFTKNSKYKVWWKCHICGKEVEKEIKSYRGCSACKKQVILNERNLSITHPNLILEWNYEKNGKFTPDMFTKNSKYKVWWKCAKCGYEWQARISNRAILNRGCPCCTNKKVVVGVNDLSTTHPEIAKEWHPTKNGDLSPQKVTYGSGKMVWWLCSQGHEYKATILHRTQENGTNCPVCNSGRQTSFAEQAVYYYVKKLYPDAINRYTVDFLGKMELDIYIPSIKYAIEYDGEAWHKKDKVEREQRKYKICHENGIKLIRLREKKSEIFSGTSDIEIFRDKLYEHKILQETIMFLLDKINFNKKAFGYNSYDVNIKRDEQEILQYKTILKGDSFQDKYPEIAKEWHPTKNNNLKPNMFKPRSDHKVWWLCPVCGYEYEATIGHRTDNKNPTGCPKCGIEKSARAQRKAVNMINPETNELIRIFSSITEAAEMLNINGSNITSVCKGQRNRAGGYKWSYVE